MRDYGADWWKRCGGSEQIDPKVRTSPGAGGRRFRKYLKIFLRGCAAFEILVTTNALHTNRVLAGQTCPLQDDCADAPETL